MKQNLIKNIYGVLVDIIIFHINCYFLIKFDFDLNYLKNEFHEINVCLFNSADFN